MGDGDDDDGTVDIRNTKGEPSVADVVAFAVDDETSVENGEVQIHDGFCQPVAIVIVEALSLARGA